MDKKILLQELFYFLTIAWLSLSLLELGRPRLVLAYINLNWLLMAWLFVGVVLLFFQEKQSP